MGNDLFAWFESTDSKSRINFLRLLRAGHDDYRINEDALVYMEPNNLAKSLLRKIREATNKHFLDDEQWQGHLKDLGIVDQRHRHIRIATEGALIGAVLDHGLPKSLVIVSGDDAGQFNFFLHDLCWIHAERTINKLIAPDKHREEILEKVRKQIWDFYDELKDYKASSSQKKKERLEATFDEIFTQNTDYQLLNLALKRLYNNKQELLLVLRPEIPLHNNLSENDIREYVKRRKIIGSTRSAMGRRCRDTFTSLKKTARKLGVSFWQFLLDRTSNQYHIPPLPQLIAQQANAP